MTVATFNQPNNTTMTGTQYLANVDAGFSVFAGVAGQFAPHQQATANMTVVIDAGSVLNGANLTSKAQQSTGVITAPTNGTQRIDRVVISTSTGNVSVITGTQSNSPAAPALVTGNFPVAQIALLANSTAITNSMITDERNFSSPQFNGTLTSLLDISANTAGQIKFPAAQNASSDPNTLDDYEEGVWTPSCGGNATYGSQAGTYVKIGKMVFVNGSMSVTTLGTGFSASITNLPFTVEANSTITYPGGGSVVFSGIATNVTTLVPAAQQNTTNLNFYSTTASGPTLSANPVFPGTVHFSLTYRASS
jgi:hypothetical protein